VPVTVGNVTMVKFVNPPDTSGHPGTWVYIHKLNCTEPHDPRSINGHDVATGNVPSDCTVAPGVDFEVYGLLADGTNTGMIQGPDGPYWTTDGSGTFVVFVEKPIESLTLVEHLATNPLANQNQNSTFTIGGVQNDDCPCHATDKVVVNKVDAASGTTSGGTQPSTGQSAQPTNPAPTPTDTPTSTPTPVPTDTPTPMPTDTPAATAVPSGTPTS
jgi:hypothetical protein